MIRVAFSSQRLPFTFSQHSSPIHTLSPRIHHVHHSTINRHPTVHVHAHVISEVKTDSEHGYPLGWQALTVSAKCRSLCGMLGQLGNFPLPCSVPRLRQSLGIPAAEKNRMVHDIGIGIEEFSDLWSKTRKWGGFSRNFGVIEGILQQMRDRFFFFVSVLCKEVGAENWNWCRCC